MRQCAPRVTALPRERARRPRLGRALRRATDLPEAGEARLGERAVRAARAAVGRDVAALGEQAARDEDAVVPAPLRAARDLGRALALVRLLHERVEQHAVSAAGRCARPLARARAEERRALGVGRRLRALGRARASRRRAQVDLGQRARLGARRQRVALGAARARRRGAAREARADRGCIDRERVDGGGRGRLGAHARLQRVPRGERAPDDFALVRVVKRRRRAHARARVGPASHPARGRGQHERGGVLLGRVRGRDAQPARRTPLAPAARHRAQHRRGRAAPRALAPLGV
jgi:hypothetical protein